MKKLFYLAAAITVMASCTSETIVGDANNAMTARNDGAIVFGSAYKGMTRADFTGNDAATKLGNNFVVQGVKGNGSTQEIVFNNYNVNWVNGSGTSTTSNTSGWEYVAQTVHAHATTAGIAAQSIKYWDYTASQYDFIAYSAGADNTAVFAAGEYNKNTNVLISAIDASKMNGVDSDNDGKIDQGAYTIKGKATNLAKVYIADMVTAYANGTTDPDHKYQDEVEFKFRSLSAKVRVALYETIPGYSVKDVVFYTDASTAADDGKAHLFTTGDDVFNEEGTYTVYFPTTGASKVSATDYNKAHIVFSPETEGTSGTSKEKGFGALDNFQGRDVNEAASTVYLGRNSTEATYAGIASPNNYYTIVIPNETGAVLNLKVNYTLVSTDGSGETINVTGATAQVPAIYATWKSGYAYTYMFKISQDTSGKTNPALGPAGLYPITFDAVVMNNEVDGIQETITTVADPSITTYAKGEVVTANNEYLTGNNIYAIVANGTELTTSNAKLYTVTLETGAAQTINEASVANALAHGTESPTGTWTVTDANGKKMTVTAASGLTTPNKIAAEDAPDGNEISVNCAKFTPAAPTFTVVASGTAVTSGTTYYTADDGSTKVTLDADGSAGENQYWTKTATTAGTYVFEYKDASDNLHYKIIKVVDKY